jgi:integrase
MAIHKIHASSMPKLLRTPGLHSDGGKLYLRVKEENLSASWVMRYRDAGKRPRLIHLAPAHTMSIDAARDKARELRAAMLDGKDPRFERNKVTTVPTFEQCMKECLAQHPHPGWESNLRNHAVPVIGSMPVDNITLQHIENLFKPIWRSKPEIARKTRQAVAGVINYAIGKEWYKKANPALYKDGPLSALLGKQNAVVESHESLPFEKLPDFMAKLRQRDGIEARGLEFMILTNGRRAHLRGVKGKKIRPPMQWAHVDLDEGVWTIPGSKMHGTEDFPVPLSDQAVELLRQVQALKLHPDIVFYSDQTENGELGEKVMLELAREVPGIATLDVHGFRSTFKTYADEILDCGKDNPVVETCMDHRKVGDTAQEKAYRRGTFFAKRAKLMQEWADYATGSTSIVPLRKAS